jgi:hypothetical protein
MSETNKKTTIAVTQTTAELVKRAGILLAPAIGHKMSQEETIAWLCREFLNQIQLKPAPTSFPPGVTGTSQSRGDK